MTREVIEIARKRHRRPLRPRTWALLGLVAMLAAAAGSWMWTGVTADWRLRAAIAEADRQGTKWRLADLLEGREAVPPEANSAIRVARVYSRMPPRWPAFKKGSVSTPWSQSPGGFEDYSRVERIDDLPPNERPDDGLIAAIRRNLRAMGPAVIEARGLAEMDRGRIDVPIAKLVYNTLLGAVQNTRNVGRLIELDAMLRAHDGDLDGALDSCRALIGCGRSIGDDVFLISQLVRMAIVRRGLRIAERVIAQGEPSDASLARLQALLVREAAEPSLLQRGIRGERAGAHDVLGRLAAGEHTPGEVNQAISSIGVNRTTEVLATVSNAYIVYNHALSLEAFNEATVIAGRPFADQVKLWAKWEAAHAPPQNWLPQIASQIYSDASPLAIANSSQAYGAYQAQLQAMVAALGAERHRLRHGSFPDRLDAIDGDLLPMRPVDPFTGEPIRLSPNSRGLNVYSLGPDRRDDRGERLNPRKPQESRCDLGYRLFAAADRGRPAREEMLPEDVFQSIDEGPSDAEAAANREAEPVRP